MADYFMSDVGKVPWQSSVIVLAGEGEEIPAAAPCHCATHRKIFHNETNEKNRFAPMDGIQKNA